MPARTLAILLAALTVVIAPVADAAPPRGPEPADQRVDALDDHFLPSTVQVHAGGRVAWGFTGSRTHTVTDASGLDLFDSGLVAPGGPSFVYAFAAAGTYRYVCTLHETMRGRVGVVVEVSRRRQPHGRPVALTWATGDAPTGSVYDVQLKRPGRPWRTWIVGTAEPGGELVPRHAGTFRIRARTVASGGATEWSPATRFVAT